MQEVSTLPKENRLRGNLKGISAKLAAHPLLLAFLFNLVAFLLRIIIFDIKYEVSDDYITDAVLSGAFGLGYDPQLLFGNVILGYALVFLYKLIPVISFYFVLLICLSFISVTVVLYLLFKKKVNTITVCIAVIYLSFITDDLYVLVQFTKVAAAAGIAGGLLILHGLWEVNKHKISYVVLGSLLMILGSMVRSSTIYIFSAFLVLAFLCHTVVLINKKDENKKSAATKKDYTGILVRFAICVVIIGILFGLNTLGSYIKNQDGQHLEFNTYHSLRTAITDKTRPPYDLIEAEYQALGFDELDYVMLNSWNFDDREVYSDEILQEVAIIHKNAVASNPLSLGDALHVVSARGEFNYPAAFALYIPALLAIAFDKKRIYYVLLVVASFAMLAGFVLYGRTMYRVEWGVYFCAASCALASFDYDETATKIAGMKKKLFSKERNTIAIYTVVLVFILLVARVPRIISGIAMMSYPDAQYRAAFYNSLYNSGEFINEKIGFPTLKRKVSPNLINYIENDTEHYYYVDFATGIQDLYFDYDPWIRPEEGLFCKEYAYFGGCTMRHPGEIYALEQNGCDPYSPFKSLVNENIYLIDNWGALYKTAYINRYYYPDATIELVDEIDGYKIWNIYVPENTESEDN